MLVQNIIVHFVLYFSERIKYRYSISYHESSYFQDHKIASPVILQNLRLIEVAHLPKKLSTNFDNVTRMNLKEKNTFCNA